MPIGVPLDITLVDDELLQYHPEEISGWVDDGTGGNGNWRPCRVSVSRWYSSDGGWENFGSYRDAPPVIPYHKRMCNHRYGYPRAFHQEELNMSDKMNFHMHDPVVLRTKDARLKRIMTSSLKNYHLVLRRGSAASWLSYVIESPDYSPKISALVYGATPMGVVRRNMALKSMPLGPCPDCVQLGEITLITNESEIHGDYIGGVLPLIGSGDTILDRMKNNPSGPQNWAIIEMGVARLALPRVLIEQLQGYRFNGLKVSPDV
jgi:hypothetical protein